MPTDVEGQIHDYCRWLDDRTGTNLHRPAGVGDEAAVVSTTHSAFPEGHRIRLPRVLAVAAAVALIVALAGLRLRHGVPAAGQRPVTTEAWYEIDPQGAFASLGSGQLVAYPGSSLACRRYDQIEARCSELIGGIAVDYRLNATETVTVSTEHGPDESGLWQMLRGSAEPAQVGDRPGLALNASGQWTVGFEIAPDTRVTVQGAPSQSRATVVAIAGSLALTQRDVVVPIVFGDSTPSLTEMPLSSVAARYYAGYVDMGAERPCVGAFGMPWNNVPQCNTVPDDRITITVASPSPTGTILIAALPRDATSAEVRLQDGSTVPLVITSVPGFAPRLVFADLDAGIPITLTAFGSTGNPLGDAAVVSTGGAPLGFLPAGE